VRSRCGSILSWCRKTVCALESFHDYSKAEISGALIPLLEQPALRVEGARTVVRALEVMAESKGNFVDALLAETARSRAEGVASFDKDFRKVDIAWHEAG
jgi:predicted nucleic acid-binding protein